MATALVPLDHARLSASGAHKWINCAGSIAAEAPFPDTSSKYADEGSSAHAYAAVLLDTECNAVDNIGLPSPVYPDYPLTADMAEHIQTYLDYVRGLWAFCDERWIESKALVPDSLVKLPEDVGGTSDAGGIDYAARTLHVTDLKFGRGVLVEVEGNEQFRIYALAQYGTLTHADKMRLAYAEMHVIQPRAQHPDGPIRSEKIRLSELLLWGIDVLGPAAFAALVPGAPRAAGDWCKFCKAKSTCETFRTRSFEAMPFTFEDMAQPAIVPAHTAPLMTPEQVGVVWSKLGLLEEWVKAFRSFVYNELASGRAIPGVGMKRKRTNRKWMDEDMVADYIDSTVTESIAAECFQHKPLSVAQLEKVAKQHPEYLTFPEHLVVQDEGELTLCKADDKHALPSLPNAVAQFTFEEAGL